MPGEARLRHSSKTANFPVLQISAILPAGSSPIPGNSVSAFSSATRSAALLESPATTREAFRYARIRNSLAPSISNRSATSSNISAISEL